MSPRDLLLWGGAIFAVVVMALVLVAVVIGIVKNYRDG